MVKRERREMEEIGYEVNVGGEDQVPTVWLQPRGPRKVAVLG
jgi:hypothetical protein